MQCGTGLIDTHPIAWEVVRNDFLPLGRNFLCARTSEVLGRNCPNPGTEWRITLPYIPSKWVQVYLVNKGRKLQSCVSLTNHRLTLKKLVESLGLTAIPVLCPTNGQLQYPNYAGRQYRSLAAVMRIAYTATSDNPYWRIIAAKYHSCHT